MSDFGLHLKKLRTIHKLSIRQLATLSDVSAAYLSQIETNSRGTPSPEVIKKLHKPLRVSYDSLMRKAGHIDASSSEYLYHLTESEKSVIEKLNSNKELMDLILGLDQEAIAAIVRMYKVMKQKD
jgi:transcriptional regulator with XRE-family HTH domain